MMKTLAVLALAGLTACGAESALGPDLGVVASRPEERMNLDAYWEIF